MPKNVYTHYKERLTQIAGASKSLCLSSIIHSNSCDIGKILSGRDKKIAEFQSFLFSADRNASFTLISSIDQKELLEQTNSYYGKSNALPSLANLEKAQNAIKTSARRHREDAKKLLSEEILSIKTLNFHCEDIQRETGKNELYVGYPFVFGTLAFSDTVSPVKAPLLLFPVCVEIKDGETVIIKHDKSEKILINPSFISAYSYVNGINTDGFQSDFSSIKNFKSIRDLIFYLQKNQIDVEFSDSKNIFAYSRFKEPSGKNCFSIRYAAVLSRFSFSQPIYTDYIALESANDSHATVDLLCEDASIRSPIFSKARGVIGKIARQDKWDTSIYTLKNPDYRKLEAISKISDGKSYVINTPPFTDCASVCADMIANAVCNKKRVLLISDKKMALDTIYSSLDTLREQCVYLNDESSERDAFYKKLRAYHEKRLNSPVADIEELLNRHKSLTDEIKREENLLCEYFKRMHERLPFGLSLSEMYGASFKIKNGTQDASVYRALIQNSAIMALDYQSLKIAIDEIIAADLACDYYEFVTENSKNQIYAHMRRNIDTPLIKEMRELAETLSTLQKPPLDEDALPYCNQAAEYYAELRDTAFLDACESTSRRIKLPCSSRIKCENKEAFLHTLSVIHAFAHKYEPFKKILDTEGYTDAIKSSFDRNRDYLKDLAHALSKYERMQILKKLFDSVDQKITEILDFAIENSKGVQNYLCVIEKIIPLRLSHEISNYEKAEENFLCNAPSAAETKKKILRLRARASEIALKISVARGTAGYISDFAEARDSEDYLSDIHRSNSTLSIKKFAEHHEELLFSLFPVWLLTPDNASSILPLKKNLFDLVIFDGASQIFIEEAIPSIYRAKTIVVMGDGKQIHPTPSFMRRMLGNDDIQSDEANTELNVKSLYDIAAKKFPITKLSYHYGTHKAELINFSNQVFYSSELIVAPKTHKKQRHRPLELHSISGKVTNGCCEREAREVINILAELATKKRSSGSIGIITFTSEQRDKIASMLEDEMAVSEELRRFIEKEKARKDDASDAFFFIKTAENAQGEKRDVIILSPTICKDNVTRPSASDDLTCFDLETSINVAITRAKQKFILVNGISVEDLSSDTGEAKLYKKFLEYVKSISDSQNPSDKSSIDKTTSSEKFRISSHPTVAEEISKKLIGMGYSIQAYPGDKSSRISLAIYDEEKDRYLLGIIFDEDSYNFSNSISEREIYYPIYLQEMGWTILRVTSREWWNEPKKVLNTIITLAEYNRTIFSNG